MLAGLYIAVSGWIVGFTGPLQIHNLIIGATIVAMGFGFGATDGSTHRIAWVCPVLGAWTIVAYWAVSGAAASIGTLLGNIIAGAIVLVLGLALLGAVRGAGERAHRPGARFIGRAS